MACDDCKWADWKRTKERGSDYTNGCKCFEQRE